MPKLQSESRSRWTGAWQGLIAVLVLSLANATFGQDAPPGVEDVKPGEEIYQVSEPLTKIDLITLDTRVLETTNKILIVDGFNPDVVSVTPLSPHRIRIHGESPGVTNVKLIDEFDGVFNVEVFVEPDTRELQAYLKRLFPGSTIEVIALNNDVVVLRGWVTEPVQIPEIIAVSEEFFTVVQNQLKVGGVSQVQLHVKVMEIQRTKIRELGFNFLLLGQQYFVDNAITGLHTLNQVTLPFGGPPAVTWEAGNPEFQFAVTGNSDIFQGFLKALQSEALAKVLAEPVLVTTSGRPASMLSGGEFPVLVPQGVGATSIEWREFGVRMEAVPIVLGNGRLRLDIAPEVSERDFSNAVSVGGLVVPGITSRRVNTQVEMRFGETLMIGGLISQSRTGATSKVPFLGELPWIGAAFSKKDYSIGETELLIMVTPQMAAALSPYQLPAQGPGENSDWPTDKELYFDGMLEVPNFGPDCETCPLPDQLYVPQGVVAPGAQQIPPAPPAEANAGIIQRTSAESPVRTGEYRVTTERDLSEARSPVRHAEMTTRQGSDQVDSTSSRTPRRRLPGLIRPTQPRED